MNESQQSYRATIKRQTEAVTPTSGLIPGPGIYTMSQKTSTFLFFQITFSKIKGKG